MWQFRHNHPANLEPPTPRAPLYHERKFPSEEQQQLDEILRAEGGLKYRGKVVTNMRDVIAGALAFDATLHRFCAKERGGKEIAYAAQGGIATSAFTRDYAIVIPTDTEALGTVVHMRDTKDADMDVDYANPVELWEKLAKYETKGHGGQYHPPHGMGPGYFAMSENKTKFYWKRDNKFDGDVPFDLSHKDPRSPFRVEDLYPRLNAFDHRLIKRVDILEEGHVLGAVNVYRAPVILLMKLDAHPRTGGLNGAQHKDLLDIAKIIEVSKRNPNNHALQQQLDLAKIIEVSKRNPNNHALQQQLDLVQGSAELKFLMDSLAPQKHKELLDKAHRLKNDRNTALEVSHWELEMVKKRLQGGQDQRALDFSAYLHSIGIFGEDHVKQLANRYQIALGDLADILETSVHHQRSLAKHWPQARANFADSYAAY